MKNNINRSSIKELQFSDNGCGYLEAKQGKYTLTYGARATKTAPWYIGICYDHCMLNDNWLKVYNEQDAKKVVLSEYKRVLKEVKRLKYGPLDKHGYCMISRRVTYNKKGTPICDKCGHVL